MSFKNIFKEVSKFFAIGCLVIVILFPLYYLLLYSLLPTHSFHEAKYGLVIQEWNWANFFGLFNSEFWIAVGYTFVFVGILICLRVITYSLAIAGLLKMPPTLQKIFLYFFLIISLIPEFSIYLSLQVVLNYLNIASSLFAVVTNAIFSFFSFTYVFNIAKHTATQKAKLILNDNLKWHQKIVFVYLPKLKLAYFLLIIFTFISVWNDYLWPSFLLRSTPKTNITIWYLNLGITSGGILLNIQAAGATISVIIPLTIYAIFSRKINKFN
ncbi:glycerol ABC transporter permease [Mycoplasmopsis californica]|uniref:Glycerol ABC transporter permease n=1 Tax=Mycoplasmopsis californica TaxID=2113 RepID=A0A059XVF0_9BACT|nr:carbohydrate ABC transporter permease [Mycoplasmopsis californica]AIA29227.1 glycerol ABC transporter permease [Mycoplasmopsis californica]